MKLLLALDFFTTSQALQLLDQLAEWIDIVEIGTPFIIREGVSAIREVKKNFPHLKVMADLKIMDAGEYETRLACESGADIVTVLGFAHESTIQSSVKVAKEFDKAIMVDMIGVENIGSRSRLIDKLGVHYICVHTAFDIQVTGKNSLNDLQLVKTNIQHSKTAIAGGINLTNIDQIAQEKPDIVIVGSGITRQKDKKKTVLNLKNIMTH